MDLLTSYKSTHFDQLDDFASMQIFDYLFIGELASMALLSPRYHSLITKHYIQNKHHLDAGTIVVNLREGVPRIKQDFTGKPFSSRIMAIGYSQSISLLAAFGHLFNKMAIVIDTPRCAPEIVHQMARTISQHCSSASQLIRMTRLSGYLDVDFAFTNATDIELFNMYRYENEDDSIALDVAFPRMAKLSTNNADYLRLNRHFPHLRHFTLLQWREMAHFDTFIRLNRQLRSFEAPAMCKHGYLREVNELLPNLESLRLQYFNNLIDTSPTKAAIRFANVKRLTIHTLDLLYMTQDVWQSLSQMTFDRLRTFKLISYQASNDTIDAFIDLMSPHELTGVEFEKLELTHDVLLRLEAKLPKLKALNLYCSGSQTPQEIRRFLAESTRVTNLVIGTSEGKSNTCLHMDDLQNGWKVIGNRNKGWMEYLILERV